MPAYAQSPLTCTQIPLKVGFFDFPPFYTQAGEEGEPQGLLVDELQQLMSQLGCQWQGKFDTAPKMLEKIIHGDTDMVLVIRHPMLNGRANYSHNPISQLKLNIYRTQGTSAVESLEQLRQKRIILIRGYGYGGLFKKLIDPSMEAELHIASDHQAGLEMLRLKRGDYLLGYQRPTSQALAKVAFDDVESHHLQTWDVHAVISSHYSDKSLLAMIDLWLKNNATKLSVQ
ncbi:MAG: transporter substrate-binding domain-containing protein [Halopseudomonas sp.]